MKNYELTYLISPDFSESEVANTIAKVTNTIREKEGSIKKTAEPSKMKLAYLIEKKSEAFIVSTDFSIVPEKISELEKFLKEQNEILRYTVLAKKEYKEKADKRRTKPQPVASVPSPGGEEEPSKAGKVELKEIDEKIDEILS